MVLTIEVFLELLFVTCAVTMAVTEQLKRAIPSKNPNLIALVVSLVSAVAVILFYCLHMEILLSLNVCIMAFVMWVSTFFGSTIGYDKIKQIILSIKQK